MKIAVVSLFLIQSLSSASAFSIQRPTLARPSLVALSSDKPDDEEEGLDLDLGEMFEMFEAADKEESFDDTIKKVKGE